jgi:hypothetical protein
VWCLRFWPSSAMSNLRNRVRRWSAWSHGQWGLMAGKGQDAALPVTGPVMKWATKVHASFADCPAIACGTKLNFDDSQFDRSNVPSV